MQLVWGARQPPGVLADASSASSEAGPANYSVSFCVAKEFDARRVELRPRRARSPKGPPKGGTPNGG